MSGLQHDPVAADEHAHQDRIERHEAREAAIQAIAEPLTDTYLSSPENLLQLLVGDYGESASFYVARDHFLALLVTQAPYYGPLQDMANAAARDTAERQLESENTDRNRRARIATFQMLTNQQ